MVEFDYDKAFSRNLGWLTEDEFQDLKKFKIAIAGMGGVGGSHLMALVRMGFSRFVIADFDHFELPNFNRQYGASLSSLGQNKSFVMKEMALKVNPHLEIKVMEEGVSDWNLEEFLDGVNLYADGLDLFELDLRQKIFRYARSRNIPCITSAPLGYGASCLVFDSKSMSFDRYFQFRANQPLNNLLKFVLGLAPSLMQVQSLVEKKYSNLAQGRTCSTPVGCFAASALICTEAVKILLGRGIRHRVPVIIHYDFYLHRMKKNTVFWGLRHPLMRLKFLLLKAMLRKVDKKHASYRYE